MRNWEYGTSWSLGDEMRNVYISATVPTTRTSITMPLRMNLPFNLASGSAEPAPEGRLHGRV